MAFDPSKRYRFVFGFTHEDYQSQDPDGIVKLFMFTSLDEARYETLVELCEGDEVLDFSDETEQYGVHDFVTIGQEELIGYTSYEVEPQNTDKVMELWHKFFADHGVEVAAIETYTYTDYISQYQRT